MVGKYFISLTSTSNGYIYRSSYSERTDKLRLSVADWNSFKRVFRRIIQSFHCYCSDMNGRDYAGVRNVVRKWSVSFALVFGRSPLPFDDIAVGHAHEFSINYHGCIRYRIYMILSGWCRFQSCGTQQECRGKYIVIASCYNTCFVCSFANLYFHYSRVLNRDRPAQYPERIRRGMIRSPVQPQRILLRVLDTGPDPQFRNITPARIGIKMESRDQTKCYHYYNMKQLTIKYISAASLYWSCWVPAAKPWIWSPGNKNRMPARCIVTHTTQMQPWCKSLWKIHAWPPPYHPNESVRSAEYTNNADESPQISTHNAPQPRQPACKSTAILWTDPEL